MAVRDPSCRRPELSPQELLLFGAAFKFPVAAADCVAAALNDDTCLDLARELGRKRLQKEWIRLWGAARGRRVNAPTLNDVRTQNDDGGSDEGRGESRHECQAPKVDAHALLHDDLGHHTAVLVFE